MYSASSCSRYECGETCIGRDGGEFGGHQQREGKLIYLPLQCELGAEVGYVIRFEDCTSDKTVIKCNYRSVFR